jgi:hypothetical protein
VTTDHRVPSQRIASGSPAAFPTAHTSSGPATATLESTAPPFGFVTSGVSTMLQLVPSHCSTSGTAMFPRVPYPTAHTSSGPAAATP